MSLLRSPGTAPPRPARRRLAVLGLSLLSLVAVDLVAAPSTVSATSAIAPPTSWDTVLYDTFDGSVLSPNWKPYNGVYGSGINSCAVPSHNTVAGGYLHLKFYYEASPTAGKCGAGWYAGGMTLDNQYSSVSQRVTTRFRVLQTGGIMAHRIIPMRWPDAGPGGGEEDYCESNPTSYCSTFLHWLNFSGREAKKYFVDLSQWHTSVVTRDGYHVTVSFDGVLEYDYVGNSTTLPPTMKHVVLQQECDPLGACPSGTTGSEDIQIDSIRVENPGAVPANAVTAISPTSVNVSNSAAPLNVAGVSSGASSVSVTVTDGAATTAAVTTTPTTVSPGAQEWSVDVDSIDALSDGVLTVTAKYLIGGVWVNGPGMTLLKDTQAPQTPQSNVASGTYFTARTVTLTNAAGPAPMYYTLDGTVPSTSSSRYGLPVRVAGSKTMRAISIDAAGNPSGVSTTNITIKSGQALTAPNLAPASDSGVSNSDNITSRTTLALTGYAPVGTTVQLFVNAVQAASTQVTPAGTYSFAAVPFNEGVMSTTASAVDASGQATPSSAPIVINVDTTGPTLAASPAGGSYADSQIVAVTADESAKITYSVVPAGSEPIAPATAYSAPIAMTQTAQLNAVATDLAGNTSSSPLAEAYTITSPADPPPAVEAPTATLATNNLGLADQIRVTVAWSATDASGVQSYQLQKSTNGGPWNVVTLSTPLSTSTTLAIDPRDTAQFKVRATDANGNVSFFTAGRAFGLRIIQEDPSAAMSFAGGSWTSVASTPASAGHVRRTSSANNTVSFSFTGDSISWVAPRGPDQGKAEVSVDGGTPVAIDLYTSSVSNKSVVFQKALANSGGHTITVTSLGARRNASTGTAVNIDAFCVLTLV